MARLNSARRRRDLSPRFTSSSQELGASAKPGARLGGNMVGPSDEGDATGRGQPVKPAFDPLEPTVDIALKDFSGVRSKYPKVPRTAPGVQASALATASAC